MQTKIRPQKLTALPPADLLGARFCQWFNHPWDFIHADQPALKEKPQWFTERRYPIGLRTLWREYQDPDRLIGLRFSNETRYCLIDIDRGSVNHPANNFSGFKDVLAALENIGLCRPLVVRSSDSDGIHVYYFLPELLPTFNLASAIKFALEDAGLQLCAGQLESFPNVKAPALKGKISLYQGHRLPLQVGSYLLDDDAQPLSNDLTQFLNAADVAATHQDLAALKKAITAAEKNRFKLRFTSAPADTLKKKREIEEEIAQGWTGSGQTNNLLIRIANDAIFWKHLQGEDLVNYIEATAIAAPGYKEHCRHQHEIRKRAAEVAKMADGYWTPYCSYPDRYGRSYKANFKQQGQQNNIVEFSPNQANVERSQQAAARIQQAIAYLETTNTNPCGISARAAAIINTVKELTGSGISFKTLYQPRHLSLWHPEHQKSPEPAQGELLHPVLKGTCDQEQPEPAQGELLHPVSPNEVFVCDDCLPENPQRFSEEVEEFIPGEEREEGILPAALPIIPDELTAPAAVPAALTTSKIPMTPDTATTRRLTRIFLAAGSHAEKAVRQQAVSEGRILPPGERSRLLTAAKWRYLWKSGEPLWMDEVRNWVADNPDILPEAESLGITVASLDPSCDPPPEFQMGDRVWWNNCPGHCAWMNPFTVNAIDGDMACLDFYSKPVPISQLRRYTSDS